MDEDVLEVGSPLVLGGLVLRPIARRRIATVAGEHARGILARLEPVGVVVEDGERSRTLDLDGEELPEDVLAELPDVEAEP